jgi:hypothetical protein
VIWCASIPLLRPAGFEARICGPSGVTQKPTTPRGNAVAGGCGPTTAVRRQSALLAEATDRYPNTESIVGFESTSQSESRASTTQNARRSSGLRRNL